MAVVQSRCRYGPMMYLDNDKYIGHSLGKYGESHYHQVEFLKRFLKEADAFIDVGANIGTITVPLAKECSFAIAFEPQRFIYHMLCGNLALNELGNVRAYNKFVSDKIEASHVQSVDYSNELNFGGVQVGLEYKGEVVKSTTIDELIAFPKLIKIDVEGMESSVLRGARKTIQRTRPFLYVECTHNVEELLRVLHSLEYEWTIHEPPAYNKWSYHGHKLPEDDSDILKGIVSSNLICYHREHRLVVEDDFLVKDVVMPRHVELQSIWEQIKTENN